MFERKKTGNVAEPGDWLGPLPRRAFFAFALLLVGRSRAIAHAPPPYLVIVHASNRLVTVDRALLSDIFLKKRTSWPDDRPAQPVDLGRSSVARRAFSRDVLKRSVEAVKEYWVQRIFSGGDVPPPELATDAAVVDYVAARVGAVGYVSPGAELRGTRVIAVR